MNQKLVLAHTQACKLSVSRVHNGLESKDKEIKSHTIFTRLSRNILPHEHPKKDSEIKSSERQFRDMHEDRLDKDNRFSNISTDLWTIKDDLGLNVYAHTLAKFLTHRETHFPLSITIQAPCNLYSLSSNILTLAIILLYFLKHLLSSFFNSYAFGTCYI